MATLRVIWTLPATRTSGRPLDPADIDRVDLELSSDGGQNYGSVGSYGPAVLTDDFTELEIGTWFVRATVYDTSGRASVPAVASIEIPDETAPGPVVLTLELV